MKLLMRQSVKNSTKSKISTNVNMKRGSDSEGAAEMQHGTKVCRSEQARWEHLQRDLLHRRSVHGTVMAERCAPTWVKVTRRTSTSTVDSGKASRTWRMQQTQTPGRRMQINRPGLKIPPHQHHPSPAQQEELAVPGPRCCWEKGQRKQVPH